MKSDFSLYSFMDSIARIDEILISNDADYVEKNSIPSSETLTFTNGFYVYCAALFVDIRGSTDLAANHKNPILAKIYRSYISELVAVFRGDAKIKEIFIEGDCVWGVFDTPFQKDIDAVFMTAAQAASLIDILNFKLSKRKISQFSVGIGMAYGRALMIKAGYKTSGVNEIAWMGTVIAEAARLCSYGNKSYGDKTLMVSDTFYENLRPEFQKLLEYNGSRNCYTGYVIDTTMDKWVADQRLKDPS